MTLKNFELSYNSSTVEFQLFAMIDGANGKVNEMKMVEPLNLCDDYWVVNAATSNLLNSNALQITMELKHSNVTQIHYGSWTVILFIKIYFMISNGTMTTLLIQVMYRS